MAVTITAAMFLALDWPPCVVMPRFCSMARMDCSVKGEERRLSPVPCRPTTRPYPISWLSRPACRDAISLIRDVSAWAGGVEMKGRAEITRAAQRIRSTFISP
ncbi:hypothetical protein D3C87_1884090 [compost metagenome]